MSWSASVSSVSREDVSGALDSAFNASYPQPVEGVSEQFDLAKDLVEITLDRLDVENGGMVNSISVSGHAKQGETDGNSLSINLSLA